MAREIRGALTLHALQAELDPLHRLGQPCQQPEHVADDDHRDEDSEDHLHWSDHHIDERAGAEAREPVSPDPGTGILEHLDDLLDSMLLFDWSGWLEIDTTGLTPEQAAARILAEL